MVVRRRRPQHLLPTGLPSASAASTSSSSSDAETVTFPPPRHRKPSKLPIFLVIVIAIASHFLHSGHVATLHENHLSFALLSNRERELTFFSEMAFYYSFYKQIILSNSLSSGIHSLFNDTFTEYPSQLGCLNNSAGEHGYLPSLAVCSSPESGKTHPGINVLERFNIYPEVLLAALYRFARQWNLLSSQCFQVSLGDVDEVHAHAVPPQNFDLHENWVQANASLVEIGTGSSGYVLSCDGLREPPTFYVNVVYFLAGLTTLGLSLSGWLVANCGLPNPNLSQAMVSIWGAILPVFAFFFNHKEATRVQWTPPLRESFSYPFFVVQQTVLLWLLKDSQRTRSLRLLKCLLFILLLLAVQLPWQFTQFALLTQLASLLGAYAICLLSRTPHSTPLLRLFFAFLTRLEDLVFCQLIALLLCFCAQFGNQLLLLSAYFPLLIGSLAGIMWHRRRLDRAIRNNCTPWSRSRFGPLAHMVAMAACILLVSVAVAVITRLLLGGADDGAHIVDILRVKLLGPAYRTFHTQLYTCSEAFDFLPLRVLENVTSTGLLPGSLLAVLVSITVIVWPLVQRRSVVPDQSTQSSSERRHSLPQIQQVPAKDVSHLTTDFLSLFVVLQLAAFALLASMIMRLKLFFVPQLCLSLSILAQPRLFFGSHKLLRLFVSRTPKSPKRPSQRTASSSSPWPTRSFFFKVLRIHSIFIFFVLLSAIKGWQNVREEWGKTGEFSALSTETLLNWATSLPRRADNRPWVFSGPMPIMATLRLGLITSAGDIPGLPLNTKYAITNHPHYENELLRTRTLLAYSLTSRKPLVTIWSIYRYVLMADFVVVERGWCINPHAGPGCSSSELWDLLDPNFSSRGDSPCHYAFTPDLSPEDSVRVFNGYFRSVFLSLDQSLVVLEVARRPFVFA
nr:unnamed protein product [Spirometra erinaceieuropaei]